MTARHTTTPDDGATPLRALGGTGLQVSPLTIGTSSLGREGVGTERAVATVLAALENPATTVLDTSNEYGGGRSEELVGRALAEVGGVPTGRLVVTKVDPAPGSDDFSGDRVRRSVEESLTRLGVDHLPLVHLHDPERITLEQAMAPGGPVEALVRLRDEGVVGHVGVAGGPVRMLQEYVRTGAFEAVVTHNRLTLLDRSANPLLDLCAERGVGVLNAAPYGGGILARPEVRSYAYRPATPEHLAAVAGMVERCAAAGVELAAAALQLSLRDPRITSTIVGATRPEQVERAVALAAAPVPEELWSELAALLPPERVWLGADGR